MVIYQEHKEVVLVPRMSPVQSSFSKGELSELTQGRVGTEMYTAACATLENFLIRPYGIAMASPGTFYMGEVKDSSKETRLINFVFSVNDAYQIEMGEGYFRFWTSAGQVVKTTADTADWTTATAYVVGDFVKNDSTLYYCIVANTSTSLFATDLAAGEWLAQEIYEIPNDYTEAQLDQIQFAQKNDVIYLTHDDHEPATLARTSGNNWARTDITFLNGPYQDDNLTAITLTPSATTGSITVTASAAAFTTGNIGSMYKIGGTAGSPPVQGYVRVTAYTDTTHVTATVVATLDGTGATDDWAEGAWSTRRGFPRCLTFHEQRLAFARTDTEPQGIWMSKNFIYDDFEEGSDDDDALDITLATTQANEIQWLTSATNLLAGTFGGEFIITGSGAPLTPSNAKASKQSGWGSEPIQPVQVGNYSYYVQSRGQKIRELYYMWEQDNYKSVNTTVLSEHITGTQGVKDMAYQQNPDSILWFIRKDGQIATLTREIDQEVVAWTRQKTNGIYESISTIPNPDNPYDEVWVIVKRTVDGSTVRYLEKFESPIVPVIEDDSFYVHCGLQYDAYDQTTGNALTLSAKTGTITITAGSSVFTSAMINNRIRAIDANDEMIGELKITAVASGTSATGTSTSDFSATSYAANLWGISVEDLSGLSHLEGESVAILADGAVQAQVTVSSGSITLNRDTFKLSVGLPYDCTLKTLPLEKTQGTSLGKRKSIYQVGLKVYKTLGIQIGRDTDNLLDVQLLDNPTMGVATDLYTGTIPNILFSGGWNWDSQVVIKQSNPLPCHILDIMPLVNENSK